MRTKNVWGSFYDRCEHTRNKCMSSATQLFLASSYSSCYICFVCVWLFSMFHFIWGTSNGQRQLTSHDTPRILIQFNYLVADIAKCIYNGNAQQQLHLVLKCFNEIRRECQKYPTVYISREFSIYNRCSISLKDMQSTFASGRISFIVALFFFVIRSALHEIFFLRWCP